MLGGNFICIIINDVITIHVRSGSIYKKKQLSHHYNYQTTVIVHNTRRIPCLTQPICNQTHQCPTIHHTHTINFTP